MVSRPTHVRGTGQHPLLRNRVQHADEASDYAAELASRHGLVCFDPQLGRLRPFNESDGPPVDVSLPSVICATCGQLIEVDEPRAFGRRYSALGTPFARCFTRQDLERRLREPLLQPEAVTLATAP